MHKQTQTHPGSYHRNNVCFTELIHLSSTSFTLNPASAYLVLSLPLFFSPPSACLPHSLSLPLSFSSIQYSKGMHLQLSLSLLTFPCWMHYLHRLKVNTLCFFSIFVIPDCVCGVCKSSVTGFIHSLLT